MVKERHSHRMRRNEQQRICRELWAMLHDEDAAENLTQDCFVKAFGQMRGQGMVPSGLGMGQGMGSGPGMGRGPMGKWWTNSALVQKPGLNDTQTQKIEKIFQDHRTQLIDLRANVEKAEVALQPLVEADHPNEVQVTAQIDKIAQARANLEKSNAQMLLAIRQVLTVDQWKQLRSQPGMGRMTGRRGFGPPVGQ
ncbi:MAG: Spy/CpxP family protein refolding chaperone [Terriglobales bacterium]